MSAREYIFLFHTPCIYRYNKKNRREKNVLACARILILKISKNPWCHISIEIVILHGLEPWPTSNMNREINWQRHHVMDWSTYNRKMIIFILSQCQNPRLDQAGFQRLSAFYTVTRTFLLYKFWEGGGFKPFSWVLVEHRI